MLKCTLAVQAVGAKAEGYDAADMRVLADRALHAAACRQLAAATRHAAPGPLIVRSHDLADAQQGFQPAAAWGVGHVQVQKPLDVVKGPGIDLNASPVTRAYQPRQELHQSPETLYCTYVFVLNDIVVGTQASISSCMLFPFDKNVFMLGIDAI